MNARIKQLLSLLLGLLVLCACQAPLAQPTVAAEPTAVESITPSPAPTAFQTPSPSPTEPVTASPQPTATPVPTDTPSPEPTAVPREPQTILRELLLSYALYEDAAEEQMQALLSELRQVDPDGAMRWEAILTLWKEIHSGVEVHEKVLPDGLPDSDQLCIVALGYKLNPNGTMRKELQGRLNVVLRSAKKYPRALIVCTGGGTASKKKNVTEAGRMSSWLKKKGVSKKRIFTEKQSHTTAQNAIYTYDLLEQKHPDVDTIAIISSDYHVPTGILLFRAEAILRADDIEHPRYTVVSNAGYPTKGSFSLLSQAAALLELSGDAETASLLYHGEFDTDLIPVPGALSDPAR